MTTRRNSASVRIGLFSMASCLLLILSATLLTACDTASGSAPIVRYTAEYFQSFYVPASGLNSPSVCAKAASSDASSEWFVYVNIDEIDNTSAGAADFTYDPNALQPLDSSVSHAFSLEAYLDSYWEPRNVTVPAGQRADNSPATSGPEVHQGKIFHLKFDSPTPSSDLRDSPPIVYNTTLSPTPVLLPNPHQVIPPPSSAQPTNQFLADVHDKALAEAGPPAGPCTL